MVGLGLVRSAATPKDQSTRRTPVTRYAPGRGGHAPGHLRELFGTGTEDWPNALASDEANVWWDESQAAWWNGLTVEQRAQWITGQLWNCSDILPSSVYQHLELTGLHTYG